MNLNVGIISIALMTLTYILEVQISNLILFNDFSSYKQLFICLGAELGLF
jgi:hypothetical protein